MLLLVRKDSRGREIWLRRRAENHYAWVHMRQLATPLHDMLAVAIANNLVEEHGWEISFEPSTELRQAG